MIALGCDHGGFELMKEVKAHLTEKGVEFRDFGTDSPAATDYPIYAKRVAKAVLSGECEKGILICGVQYSKTSVSPQVNYMEHYDTDGKLLWQWKEAAAGTNRYLLGAGEKNGELTCVFRSGNMYSCGPLM